MTDTAELLAIAVAVARGRRPTRPAGCAPRRRRRSTTKSTDTDVVTAADRAVERQVVAALRRPAARRRGARRGVRRQRRRPPAAVRWIVDPIDGTVNYLYGLPQYAVSLAAEVDGAVVAGVVRNAATGDGVDGDPRRRRLARRAAAARLRADRPRRRRWSPPASGTTPARRAHQARGAGRAAAAGPGHPAVRRGGARPVPGRRGRGRRVLREGAQRLGPRGGRPGRGGGGAAGRPGWPARRPGPDMVLAAPPALFGPLHDRLVALDAAGGP